MTLRVYNTLTGRKEPFEPLNPPRVGMYVCGVTVYDYCHIGHARANIVFDIVFRYLRFAGYVVTYVRNYTDVDDKIIARANERGIGSQELAEEFIRAFDEDMDMLGLAKPTFEPKATEHIDEIVQIVEKLIAKDKAYASDGDVYFRVNAFNDYLKLSKRNMDEMQAGARIAPGEKKQNPMDFALWKAAKPGEPAWESPWGPGRPGWHIECSAMSMKFLGETFDIHGGGKDLVFPHHENEIAQSEAVNDKPFAKYWLHNGFVNVNAEKMSKSLGNFFTIREILEKFDPEVVRFFILQAHYRSPIDFSDQNLKEAGAGLSRIYESLEAAEKLLAALDEIPENAEGLKGNHAELAALVTGIEGRFREAMDDDFNTALAIGHLFEVVRGLNRIVTEKHYKKSKGLLAVLRDGHDEVLRLGEVLGLFTTPAEAWLEREKMLGLVGTGMSPEIIEALIDERMVARKNKDFARSDQIRDDLDARGVLLLDSAEGTSWKLK
ncbi:MAG: cysteine--tRNA ligase [Desulfuromonas sp.]|nr:MAG: cysteine--tRNA ligase [Desulfuromonas sp.]